MSQHSKRPEPILAAEQLYSERYPSARVLFCGGSVVRGDGYASSDLDVVVVFDHVETAWRESFYFQGWPVEVFAHDPETLVYFVNDDTRQGFPSLARMIAEGMPVPDSDPWSDNIQQWARTIVASQPEMPSAAVLDQDRYAVTDLLNDFRDDRPHAELVATACKLYPLVQSLLLKSQRSWLGSGKALPRLVRSASPRSADALEHGFDTFFKTGERDAAIEAVVLVLEPLGGELFDGFRSDAPETSRVQLSEVPWLIG